MAAEHWSDMTLKRGVLGRNGGDKWGHQRHKRVRNPQAMGHPGGGHEATDTQLPKGPCDTGQAVITLSLSESTAVQFVACFASTPHLRRVELKDRVSPNKAHPPIPTSHKL